MSSVLNHVLDVATIIHAAGHVSFFIFGTYPYALGAFGYQMLCVSDATLHLLLWARDGESVHMLMYMSHALKRNVPFLCYNNLLSGVDAMSYMYSACKIRELGSMILGMGGYVYMYLKGWIW